MKTLYLVWALISVSTTLFAQSSGPKSPSAYTSNYFSGSNFSWSNVSNIASSDNNRATASALALILSGKTEYLTATGFGFNISPLAKINGITVEIEKSASNIGGLAAIQDYAVRLVKNNIVTGDNKATNTNWTGSDSYFTYGDHEDLWGTTWSVSDINSANFGVAISAEVNGLVTLLPIARIDHIRITVHYDIVLPVELISFKAEKSNSGVVLSWTTTPDNEPTSFSVQRSADGHSWKEAGVVTSTTGIYQYQFTDPSPLAVNYYRIKISGPSGAEKFSSVQKVDIPVYSSFILSPNPAQNKITLLNKKGTHPAYIKIYNNAGLMVQQQRWINHQEEINISLLKPGVYYMTIEDEENTKKEKLVFVKSD